MPVELKRAQLHAQQMKDEFHQRLIREVAKITCDVEMDSQKFQKFVRSLDRVQLADLCYVLHAEIKQVIFAVKEAK